MGVVVIAVLTIIGLIVGIVGGYFAGKKIAEAKQEDLIKEAKKKAEEIEDKARADARSMVNDAKETAKQISDQTRQAQRQIDSLRHELEKRERELSKKELDISRKHEQLNDRERELRNKQDEIAKLVRTLEEKEKELHEREQNLDSIQNLEKIAGITKEQAKEELKNRVLDEVRLEIAREVKEIENMAEAEAEKRAKKILAVAIERFASEFVNERTVSVVELPNDEMKGRIIGREGRNIRAFEAATGVDLIIDDTPEAVIISNFNPIRREVAKRALEKLIQDGRVHPARIEEMVQRARKEVEQSIRDAGQDAVFQLGITKIHPELVKYIGKLKYRMSYVQNVLQHSIEVAWIAGMMAAELGLDQKLARRAGLLHDIGKAVDHEVDGPHALIGANLARKYGESAEVVHAIAAHHYDERPMTILAHLVIAADALSGARPGARRETLENYIRRLEQLEEIANSHKGVSHSYAIQAGREVRIMVENSKVSDEEAALLAREIAKDIEEKMSFPGQIKVCVIRESRFIEYAK